MFLSICIPSYNRFEHIQKLLDSIFQAKSSDFNVIIVDNGSSKDVFEEIHCKDERLKIIKRDVIVKGPSNARLALDYAEGKYAMVCLDKDFIEGSNLDCFIELLRKSKGISCGYCELNSKSRDMKFLNKTDIVDSIYRCGHPSGSFFINKGIRENTQELDLYNPDSLFYDNPFLTDLLYAKFLLKGKQAIFQGKLVSTETLKRAANNKSHSYSTLENNIYFMPQNRKKQFNILIEHLMLLGINTENYHKIVDKIIYKTFREVSIDFIKIMKNTNICLHHGIKPKQITKTEALKLIFDFAKDLNKKKIYNISELRKKIFLVKNMFTVIFHLYIEE